MDLPDTSSILNLTIECEDNDALNDDECDMNEDPNEWKLYHEFNWTVTNSSTFSGDGTNDGDDSKPGASSTWSVLIGGYGDEDGDDEEEDALPLADTTHAVRGLRIISQDEIGGERQDRTIHPDPPRAPGVAART